MVYYEAILVLNRKNPADGRLVDDFIDRHNANAIGTREGYVRVGFDSAEELRQGDLEQELRQIKIVSFGEKIKLVS